MNSVWWFIEERRNLSSVAPLQAKRREACKAASRGCKDLCGICASLYWSRRLPAFTHHFRAGVKRRKNTKSKK